MRKKWSFLLVTLACVTLWGCGSGGSGGSSVSSPADLSDAETTGNCTICHTTMVHTELNAVVGVNPEYPATVTATNYLGISITHDCEACHGGGQFHHGVGPIPYPELNLQQCATCHTDIEAKMTKVLGSKHNYEDAENTEFLADGHDTSYCQRCHVAEGSLSPLKEVIGDRTLLTTTIVANGTTPGAGQVEALANEDADGNPLLHSPGACFTCHSPLTAELVQFDPAAWDPNQNGESDQMDMCTSCHNYKSADGTQFIASGNNGTLAFYHYTSWYRTIASTHYDDPATASKVEGYVIRETSADPCFDCHGHELFTNTRYADTTDATRDATSTIFTQWAQSGHAAGLLTAKYAVARDAAGVNLSGTAALTDTVMAAGGDDTTSGGGFTHYNWDSTFQADGTTSDRGDCQMCHTATGYMNYVADPAGYNIANNNFSHLDSWNAIGGSGQNELLYCWGCHSNAETGALRQSGPVTAVYTYNDQPIVFPDVGNSNACVVCHSGRGNNETVSTSSRFAGHHAPAAADLFAAWSHVAYEYPGLDYSNNSTFADHGHLTIESPCVSCHMGDNANHEYAVVEKDDFGVITEVVTKSFCDTCHTPGGPYEVTPTMLEEESEGYQEAGAIAQALLANTITNYTGTVVNQNNVPDNDKGAFQNAKLPTDEPGGFAHNRYYVKRALFDAIDWLEDGAIDGTIADYSATYPEGAAWLGTTRP